MCGIAATGGALEAAANLAGVKWEEVQSAMKERMRTIHFVSSHRIEQLLAEAGFHRI
jgi:hypothetical protein